MAFARPTLTELIDRVIADISSRVTGVDNAVLRRSMLGVIGRAEAGAIHMLYGYIDWVARQAIPDTAEKEYLERWAAIWGISRKTAAFATGVVPFSTALGSIIPAGTIVQRQDGIQYATMADITATTPTTPAPVKALASGASGNMAGGTALFLLSPVAGVQSAATITSAFVGGEDVEKDPRLLARLLERIQNPPQGGAQTDYVKWALEVAGVTRVWVYPLQMGAGTVTVLFVCDDSAEIIPDPAKVTEVQVKIDSRRPVTAEAFVAAPVNTPLDMAIKLSPNTPAVQAAVRAEVQDLLIRDAEPGKPILISRLREAVSLAAGEADNQIISPSADVTHSAGQFATLGTILFSSL